MTSKVKTYSKLPRRQEVTDPDTKKYFKTSIIKTGLVLIREEKEAIQNRFTYLEKFNI